MLVTGMSTVKQSKTATELRSFSGQNGLSERNKQFNEERLRFTSKADIDESRKSHTYRTL